MGTSCVYQLEFMQENFVFVCLMQNFSQNWASIKSQLGPWIIIKSKKKIAEGKFLAECQPYQEETSFGLRGNWQLPLDFTSVDHLGFYELLNRPSTMMMSQLSTRHDPRKQNNDLTATPVQPRSKHPRASFPNYTYSTKKTHCTIGITKVSIRLTMYPIPNKDEDYYDENWQFPHWHTGKQSCLSFDFVNLWNKSFFLPISTNAPVSQKIT